MKKIRKHKFLLLSVLVLLILGLWLLWLRSKDLSPEQVGIRYQQGFIEQKLDEVYELLSSEDRRNLVKEEFKKIFTEEGFPNQYFANLIKEVTLKVRYRVVSKRVIGDRAMIVYELAIPDIKNQTDEFLRIIFSRRKEKDKLNLLAQKLKALLRGEKLPRQKSMRVVNLRKEGESWKVVMGWEEKQSYKKDKLKIVSLKPQWGKDAFGRPQIMVEGKVINAGDNTIGRLELEVKFLSKHGVPLYTREMYPVAMEGDWGHHKVLLPHSEREFFDIIQPVPLGWAGKIEYKITDIVFQ